MNDYYQAFVADTEAEDDDCVDVKASNGLRQLSSSNNELDWSQLKFQTQQPEETIAYPSCCSLNTPAPAFAALSSSSDTPLSLSMANQTPAFQRFCTGPSVRMEEPKVLHQILQV